MDVDVAQQVVVVVGMPLLKINTAPNEMNTIWQCIVVKPNKNGFRVAHAPAAGLNDNAL